MAVAAIEAVGLVKSYDGVRVLDQVDVRVERGTVFALLGPNGAGKTTMVRILSTLTRADAGVALVAGFDVVRERSAVRARISLTGQDVAVDGVQTAAENLVMMGRLGGLGRTAARARASELLERFDLAAHADRRVATLSGGMRRRLDLAAGLVGSPQVLCLDEPTTGLDPRSRQQTWQLVAELAGSGSTIFLTTQYLEEADRLADRIGVLDGGRVVALGAPAELKTRIAERRLDLSLRDREAFGRVSAALGARAVRADPGGLTIGVATDGSAPHVRLLLDQVDPTRVDVVEFAVHTASLDDVFLALTGKDSVHV